MNIGQLLKKFKISITLPQKLMNVKLEEDYTSVSKNKLILDFINKEGMLDKSFFSCTVFEGDNCVLIIAPDNSFQTVSLYKKLTDDSPYIGYSLNSDAVITTRV